jgi:diacylglycerol kinase family enzyme
MAIYKAAGEVERTDLKDRTLVSSMYEVFTHEHAGRLTWRQKEYVLEDVCRELGAGISGRGLGKERFLQEIAAFAAEGNVPVLFTGDTTFGEVASSLKRGSTLSYLPGGTGCFMGFVIGYPRPYAKHIGDLFSVPDALTLPSVRSYLGRIARSIKSGAEHPLDLLLHDSGRKLLMASIGVDPRVLVARAAYVQQGYGVGTSYGLAVRDIMRDFRGIDVMIDVDGKRFERSHVATVLVTKVPYYGLGLRMAPHARIDDGLLHVRIIPRSAVDDVSIILSSVRGVQAGEHLSGKAVSIATPVPELLQGDGDLLSEKLINGFSVLPAQVNLKY